MIRTYKSAFNIIYLDKYHHPSSSEVILKDSILDSANVPQALIGTHFKPFKECFQSCPRSVSASAPYWSEQMQTEASSCIRISV